MKYLGSKARISKHILPLMVEAMNSRGITTWVEPFVGGGNMIDKVPDKYGRMGCDLNEHAIAAMLGIRDFVDVLPSSVSEEFYLAILGTEPHPLNSWIRHACSFSGKLDGGFARDKNNRNYAEEQKRAALRQSPKIRDVNFICCSYESLTNTLTNCLIYCDPPYKCTTGYKGSSFNSEKFFDWCRLMASKNNLIFVSEYSAPEDFQLVWEGPSTTSLSFKREKGIKAVEKLFKYEAK